MPAQKPAQKVQVHQCHRDIALRKQRKGLIRALGQKRGPASGLEAKAQCAAHIGLVIDNEHRQLRDRIHARSIACENSTSQSRACQSRAGQGRTCPKAPARGASQATCAVQISLLIAQSNRGRHAASAQRGNQQHKQGQAGERCHLRGQHRQIKCAYPIKPARQ